MLSAGVYRPEMKSSEVQTRCSVGRLINHMILLAHLDTEDVKKRVKKW